MKNLISNNAKAIGAFVGGVFAWVAMQWLGVEMPHDVQVAIAGAVSGFVTWLVPNWDWD